MGPRKSDAALESLARTLQIYGHRVVYFVGARTMEVDDITFEVAGGGLVLRGVPVKASAAAVESALRDGRSPGSDPTPAS